MRTEVVLGLREKSRSRCEVTEAAYLASPVEDPRVGRWVILELLAQLLRFQEIIAVGLEGLKVCWKRKPKFLLPVDHA